MTISQVFDYLSEYSPILFVNVKEEELFCVKLMTGALKCNKNDILLGRYDDFARYGIPNGIKNIIYLGTPDSAAILFSGSKINYIVISQYTDIFSLCNTVSSSLSDYKSIEINFEGILNTALSLQNEKLSADFLTSIAANLFSNPCILYKDNGKVIAVGVPDSDYIYGTMDYEKALKSVDNIFGDLAETAAIKKDKITLIKNEHTNLLFGTIYGLGDDKLYFIVVEYNPFSSTDTQLAKIFCVWAGNELKSGKLDTGYMNQVGSKYLGYLLDGRIKDLDVIIKSNKSIGFKQLGYYYLVVANSSDIPIAKGSPGTIVSVLSSKSKQILATSKNGYIIVLCSSSNDTEEKTLKQFEITNFFESLGAGIGVSMYFEELSSITNAYNQAIIALDMGQISNPNSSVHYYKDYVLSHFINDTSEHSDLGRFVLPQLRKLFSYDKEHNTKYAYTLYIMLKMSNRQISAANALNIHRTTLQYRLNKISELISLDYTDQYWVSRLYLSFAILVHEGVADPTIYSNF